MKRFLGQMILYSILISIVNPAYALLIIDHNAVDLYDDIPQSYIDEVKKMHLNYPGESHGRGLPNGLLLLQQQDSKFAVNVTWTGQPEAPTDQHLRVSKAHWSGLGWAMYGGEEHTWTSQAAINRMNNHFAYCRDTLKNNIDAFAFGWCWDMGGTNLPDGGIDPVYNVRWAGRSYILGGGDQGRWGLDDGDTALTGNLMGINLNDYLEAWVNYEQNNPDTTIIYTTGPKDYSGENGYQEHLKHERIRNWVRNSTNRVLFDYADIVCHNNLGEQSTTSWTDYASVSHTYPRRHPENAGEDDPFGYGSGHLSNEGYLKLGKAMWVLLVRLAGWDGGSNQPPVADAGPDQSVIDNDRNGNEQVTLDASASFDPDGNIVNFVWREGGAQIATGVKPTVALSVGTHNITLTVTDNGELTDTDTVAIIVSSPDNQAPLANAGLDQTVIDSDGNGSEEVTLDGSASSDPDGTIVSFVWTEGGSQIATGVNPTVTFSVGTYNITLTVTDNGGLTATDKVVISVLKKDRKFGKLPTGCYNNVINPLKGEEAIIMVEIEEQAKVKIVLSDAKGNKIKELVDEEKDAGIYPYRWDGKDDSENLVGSGLYFIHIEAGNYRKTKKIMVVK